MDGSGPSAGRSASSSLYYYSMPVDLTPFRFTATESLVYAALLKLGPSSGYAVARATRLARANAYGALDGLVSRGAAVRAPGRPARYRPTDPQELIAHLGALQGEALDRLSRALKDASHPGEPATRAVAGARALANLVLQLVARAERRVEGILAAELWRPTLPAWRRAAGRVSVELRLAGEGELEPTLDGLEVGRAAPQTPTVLLIDDDQTVAATRTGDDLSGLWSSHPVIAALARAALRSLV